MKRLTAVLVLVAACAGSMPAGSPVPSAGPLETAPGTHVLFLDLEDVAASHNVVQRVCEAKKHPLNPVLPLGDLDEWDSQHARPWESRTILYDEEEKLFKLWYTGTDVNPERWWATGYAVSQDGVRWEKPELGLHEYRGNKRNNICLMKAMGPLVKDPWEKDPARRYKMLMTMEDSQAKRGSRVAYSPDGIRWSGEEGPQFRVEGGWSKTGNPDFVGIFCDEQADPSRRYKIVWRSRVKGAKPGVNPGPRALSMAWGPDLEHLTPNPQNPIVNPNDSTEHENHFMALVPYRGQYAGIYECGWYLPNGKGNFGSFTSDLRLVASRDGERFKRVQPHQKVVSRGRRGEWDSGFLVVAGNVLVKDDTLYIYYCGQGEEAGTWPAENIPPELKASGVIGTARFRVQRMGLATLRLDGFTCLETADGETPGFATTRPIDVKNPGAVRLVVNTSDGIPDRSWIDVEVLDAETDAPIPGFAREDCRDLTVDGVRVPVEWKGKTLADLQARRIRLRFWFYGPARLYSFSFERT